MTTIDALRPAKPGEWINNKELGYSGVDFDGSAFGWEIPTDRYTSVDFQERERKLVWDKSWQIVGRVDELPKAGDWKTYQLFDQAFIIVRGRDGVIRGFVNACRHRGNLLCAERKGNARQFLCQYHLWSYDLEGNCRGILREDNSQVDRAGVGLLPVPVDTFGGFIFLTPDPGAAPLADYLGPEARELLAPYQLERFVTVMDVEEALECNWKVVMDAFQEGYHVWGVHPQLLSAIGLDPTKSRHRFLGEHSVSSSPFDVPLREGFGPEEHVAGIRKLPETFPAVPLMLPRFEELVATYRGADGTLTFPEGVTARTLLQEATRDTLAGMGLDVSGLTLDQMTDNHGWLLFPNFFMTIRAGECHTVMARPHPSGDPNRCVWRVASYMYLPAELAEVAKVELTEVTEPGSHTYFEALQQDYQQMQRQQNGLRNNRLKHLALSREEIVVANFHRVLDRRLGAGG
ncbi:aromatic ring-hydroxylating dioxygenase subunit alpha [Frankia sp. CNm7]|uniref:Aromatic ring-hydroxylating dioxygenase subunit alpha n=1 Tax=Frankia nepalensis TaxID=1836974 RepID=A0A937URZ6_9ACTN|nr:aromatic ring-hydroxylating dioxygenase subunit alpha [Frankia nepalensis]MBL7500203.1 aromatic ring-hydroxylating dioxygenase subunit alpha [Frankia nepalensis]MBL7509417.1 aromatic ring-hydroxylating dioxygenase subunit alpha [Frankia nepalensis]MBL7522771.1 aromatic ring-hydroxylating dioxygenase subunit alpha [Frankia nepalensis]MBL7631633.1 aromatic ring-hydroxylating dioxygenase subunit alpha [Frankia nepalensis]